MNEPSNTNQAKPRQAGFKLTASEKIEFELRFDLYKRALKKEMSICYEAFVQTNIIFHKDTKIAKGGDADMKKLARVAMAMRGMEKVSIRPELQAKGTS